MSTGSGASAMADPAAGSSASAIDGSSTPAFSHQNMGKLGCAIAISSGALLLITTVILACYFCTRAANPLPSRRRSEPDTEDGSSDTEAALGDDILKRCPMVTYAEAMRLDPRSAGSCCSVCLGDYGDDGEALRLLAECGHLFHERCVDPWLRLKPTCPLCRSSPALSPKSTPLSEVATLASNDVDMN